MYGVHSVAYQSGSKHFGSRLLDCWAMGRPRKDAEAPKAPAARAKTASAAPNTEAAVDEEEAVPSPYLPVDRTAASAAPEKLQAGPNAAAAASAAAKEGPTAKDEVLAAPTEEPKAAAATPVAAKAGLISADGATKEQTTAEPKAAAAAPAAKAGPTASEASLQAVKSPEAAKKVSTATAPEAAATAAAASRGASSFAEAKAGSLAPAIAEPTVGGPAVDLDLPIIRKAAAFRIKYTKHTSLLRLPVEQVGFHPKNRDGQPPNGERCCQLADDIVRIGFDRDEADAGGVCVEQKPGTSTISAFNLKACELDLYHAPATEGCISYGSLSHSHLHQVLKNIRAGMKGTAKLILDKIDNYSLAMLRAADPTFASVVDSGLLWEVLSWKMDEEEPQACTIIQAAMNSKGALFMLQHEMQAFSRLCSLASAIAEQQLASTSVANSIVEAARRQLRQTLPQYADDEGFLHMYRFVVDLGAGNESFCQDLLEFHQQWVNPEVRRIRLSVFGIMNILPLHMPHLRVAGIKHVYSCDAKFLKNGFCDNLSVKQVKDALQKHSATAEFAETVMNWFHTHTRGLGTESFKVVSVLDREVFGAVIGVRGEDRKTQVGRAAGKCFEKLELLKVQLPICPFALATGGGPPATAGSPSSVEALAPKVIRYVGGKPVMSQDVVETKAFTENIKWADFFVTEEASKLLLDEVDRATVMAAISRLQARLPLPEVSLMRGGDEKRMRVVADKCFEAGALLIAPLVQGISRLATRSTQAWALRATVSRSEDSEASTVFIVGGSTCPSMTAAALANAGSASSSSEAVSSHEWKASHFPWPFWLVRRVDKAEDANCVLVDWRIATVSTMATASETGDCEPQVDLSHVCIPVLVNSVTIERGEELVVHWAIPVVKNKGKATKSLSWFDESARLSKKPRTTK